MRPGWFLAVALWLSAADASAEAIIGEQRHDGLALARQPLPATGVTGRAQSRLVYLNKGAVSIGPGDNDSRTNRSTLVEQQIHLGGWNPDPALWTETVACIEELFAPFDIAFTQTDPGNVPHIEAVFGGKPVLLGLSNNIAGVSPFTRDCSIIESSIVFTFVEVISQNARTICEIQAQEIAHSFGLDHVVLASDPMSYLPFEGARAFRNQVAACGEYDVRACGFDGSVCRRGQNSVELLTERLGLRPGGPTPPPPAEPAPEPEQTGDVLGGCGASSGGQPFGALVVVGFAAGFGVQRRRAHR